LAEKEKFPLEEMAEACQVEADREHGKMKHIEEFYPDMRDPAVQANRRRHEHDKALWDATARILRAMACEPDESRKFIAGLLKRHPG
jgi:hypothetical protein